MPLQHRKRCFVSARRHGVIAIHKSNILPFCHCNTRISSTAQSLIVLADAAHILMPRNDVRGNLPRIGRRTIINQDNFHLIHLLRQHRGHTLTKRGGRLIERDNDGE